jgi:hypothetical protein
VQDEKTESTFDIDGFALGSLCSVVMFGEQQYRGAGK